MKYNGRKIPEGLRQVIRLNAFHQLHYAKDVRGKSARFLRRGKHALGKLTAKQNRELKHLKHYIAYLKPHQNGVTS